MAPEIVSRAEYNGAASDMWACGVIMYSLLTGVLPFKCNDEKGLFRKIQKGHYPIPNDANGDKLSIEARDLLKSLLELDA